MKTIILSLEKAKRAINNKSTKLNDTHHPKLKEL